MESGRTIIVKRTASARASASWLLGLLPIRTELKLKGISWDQVNRFLGDNSTGASCLLEDPCPNVNLVYIALIAEHVKWNQLHNFLLN